MSQFRKLVTARHPKDDGRLYFQSVHISGGGVPGPGLRSGGGSQSQIFGGVPVSDFWGGPGLRFLGGYLVSDFRGGSRSQIFGGILVSDFRGYPVSDFRGGGYLVSVKGKFFGTRFGLIHIQTRKKNFVKGTPPPSPK